MLHDSQILERQVDIEIQSDTARICCFFGQRASHVIERRRISRDSRITSRQTDEDGDASRAYLARVVRIRGKFRSMHLRDASIRQFFAVPRGGHHGRTLYPTRRGPLCSHR